MADIAILVAEEYERRIKNSKHGGGGARGEEIDLVSYVSVLSKGLDGSSWVKTIGENNMQLLKQVLEPKSQIGVAAFNGFFSA